jgi:hypothetical protein
VIVTESLASNGRFSQSHYLATGVVYLLISRKLPSNGSTCYITYNIILVWLPTSWSQNLKSKHILFITDNTTKINTSRIFPFLVFCLTMLSVAILQCRMVGWPVTDTLERSGRSVIEIKSQHLSRGNEENHDGIRTADVPAEIWTKYLPNMTLDRYRYDNPLGSRIVAWTHIKLIEKYVRNIRRGIKKPKLHLEWIFHFARDAVRFAGSWMRRWHLISWRTINLWRISLEWGHLYIRDSRPHLQGCCYNSSNLPSS